MEINKSTKKTTFIFLIFTIILTFLFYYQTLFYDIKAYDEITLLKETHLPVCFSLSEIFNLISLLGLHQYFEASNTLYSSISSLRSNPLGDFLILFTQLICKKNPVNYHLYSLILHLISSCFIFLILNRASLDFISKTDNKFRLTTVSLLTFLWATHPVNIESVLLLTNYNAVLSHALCIITVYIYFTYNYNQIIRTILLCIPFSIAVFSAEYLFMLPFILFTYTFGKSKNLNYSIKQTFPLFIISTLFIMSFIFSNSRINLQDQSLISTIERVLWLTPQILFHLIKLLVFPLKLSIDQSLFVHLGASLFSPYAISCIGFILISIICSLISLFNSKNQSPFLFLIFVPFLLSLLPFSHLFAPIYNLASERYLYFPSFILLLGVSNLIFYLFSTSKNKVILLLILLLTLIYSARGLVRTLDWKDSFSLYESAINTTNNPLHKAFRYRGLISQDKLLLQYPERELDLKFQKLAIKDLHTAISIYKNNIRKEKNIPLIIKKYGLDSKALLAKSAFILSQYDFNLNNNPASALKTITPYAKDLIPLDTSAIAFYASLLYYNNMPDKAIEVLKNGYKLKPYSIRIILSLCDLTYIQTGDLKTVEKYLLNAFKYFPYDSYIIYALANTYKQMNNHERYAYYSYIYGLRNHSLEALQTAKAEYFFLNNNSMVEKVINKIQFIEKELQKRV